MIAQSEILKPVQEKSNVRLENIQLIVWLLLELFHKTIHTSYRMEGSNYNRENTSVKEANGDVPLDRVAFSRLDWP